MKDIASGKRMKIAHIASHRGNVGDILNHTAFYSNILSKITDVEIERVELRDFYFNAVDRKIFNKKYAEYLNNYDLVIFGGGGFFDVQWNNSNTGTTLDLSEEFIDGLKTKVLVNGMGYHEYPGITQKCLCDKYKRFIDTVRMKPNWLLTYRNDGSYARMKRRFGEAFVKGLIEIPDNAFYYGLDICDDSTHCLSHRPDNGEGISTVGMCITNDLFSEEYNNGISEDAFNKYISDVINTMFDIGYRVKMLPHTPADIELLRSIFERIKNEHKRKSITVGMLDCNGNNAVEHLRRNYDECDCVIGMRFHSCIMGLNRRIPTIGLAGHEQIQGLFNEIGLSEYLIKIDNLEFKDRLICLINNMIAGKEIVEKYKKIYDQIFERKERYIYLLKSFI